MTMTELWAIGTTILIVLWLLDQWSVRRQREKWRRRLEEIERGDGR